MTTPTDEEKTTTKLQTTADLLIVGSIFLVLCAILYGSIMIFHSILITATPKKDNHPPAHTQHDTYCQGFPPCNHAPLNEPHPNREHHHQTLVRIINTSDVEEQHLLREIARGNIDTVLYLLDKEQVSPLIIDAATGMTPLHVAVEEDDYPGKYYMVRLILDREEFLSRFLSPGNDVINIRDKIGRTPLDIEKTRCPFYDAIDHDDFNKPTTDSCTKIITLLREHNAH